MISRIFFSEFALIMTIASVFVQACALPAKAATTVDLDHTETFEVKTDHSGVARAYQTSNEWRNHCKHICKISVPEGKVAHVRVEKTSVELDRLQTSSHNWIISFDGISIGSAGTQYVGGRCIDSTISSDASVVVDVTSTGPNSYVSVYYWVEVEYYEKGAVSSGGSDGGSGTTVSPVPAARSSKIHFNRQSGEGERLTKTEYEGSAFGDLSIYSEIPSRLRYSFGGYWENPDGIGRCYIDSSGKGSTSWSGIPEEASVFAYWIPATTTITFNKRGGTGGTSSVDAQWEADLPSITPPTRSGWEFQGYFTEKQEDATRRYDADKDEFVSVEGVVTKEKHYEVDGTGIGICLWKESEVTLYAYWLPTQMEYQIVLDKQGGCGGSDSVTATYESDMPQVNVPQKDKYSFGGYWSASDGGGTQYYDAKGRSVCKWDQTKSSPRLYAKWTPAYSVILHPNGGTGGQKLQYFTSPEWKLDKTVAAKSGYVFAGWAFSPDSAPQIPDGGTVSRRLLGYGEDPSVESPVTLYAIWGAEISVPQFANVKFVTGGDGDAPKWTWDCSDKTFISGLFCNGAQWLSAQFDGEGDFAFSCTNTPFNGVTFDFTYESSHAVSSVDCVDGNSGSLQAGDATHLAVWTFEKHYSSAGSSYSDTINAINLASERLDDIPAIKGEIADLLWSIVTPYTKFTFSAASNIVDVTFGDYEDGKVASYVTNGEDQTLLHHLRITTMERTGTGAFSAAENKGLNEFVRIKQLCSEAQAIYDDWTTSVEFKDSYAEVAFDWTNGNLVGFLASSNNLYETALDAHEVYQDVKFEFYAQLEPLWNRIFDLIYTGNASATKASMSWWKSEFTKCFDEIESGTMRSYWRGDFQDYVLDSLGAKGAGINIAYLSYALNPLKDLYYDADLVAWFALIQKKVDKILALRDYIHYDCGVREWRIVEYGAKLGALPANSSVYGYKYDGWIAPEGGRVTSSRVPAESEIYVENCQKEMFTVTFDSNGGSSADQQNVPYQETLSTIPVPTKSGYAFEGWYCDSAGSSGFSKSTLIETNTTLYAQWTYAGDQTIATGSYTICLHRNNSANDGTMVECPAYIGASISLSTISELGWTRQDYTFLGWATSQSATSAKYADGVSVYNLSTTKGATVHLYAVWVVVERTLSITFNANGGSVSPTSVSVTSGAAVGTLPTPTRSGYEFVGWFTAASGGTQVSASTKVSTNATYYAHWTQNSSGGGSDGGTTPVVTTYTVTFNANGGTVSPTTRTVSSGSAVGTLPTPTRSEYTFVGWFTAVSSGTQIATSTKVSSNVTYYAHWTQNSSGGGSSGESGGSGGDNNGGGGSSAGEADVEESYTATKAAVLNGAVYDDAGSVVGVVQLKVAKPKYVKKTGATTAKVSGYVMGLDGKKKTLKAVTVTVPSDAPISAEGIVVKGFSGTMSLAIGDDGFAGELGDWTVVSGSVGGNWTKNGAAVYVDTDGATLPDGVIEDLLPDGEGITPKAGKWAFAKAASVKWAKPKKGAATPEIYDEESGKGLIIDTSKGRTNLSGMRLTYTPKKGIFKGSFKVYALQSTGKATKLKKFTAKVTGVVVDGVGYGTATIPKYGTFTVTVE